MLQTIREHTQGWIAGTIITIIILSFALWGIHSYFVGGGNNSVVAEVNGVEITKEQLAVAYERLRRKVQIQYGANNNITPKDEVVFKERALQSLIEIEALKQASTAQGYRISDEQIDGYLQNMPEFQVDGRFSEEKFQEILSSTLLSISDFLDLIKTSLLIDQPKLGIIFTSFALPDETNYTISLVNQERSIEYINIPLQYFLSQPINISSDKIQAYYEKHKDEYMTPEQVNIEYVEVSLKNLLAQIKPTEAMLNAFYNENINSYTQPMEWKLSTIDIPVADNATQEQVKEAYDKAKNVSQALSKEENLAKVARDNALSQNTLVPISQDWMTLAQVPEELQKAVAELAKGGEVSDPVKTSKGYLVVKAIDVKEPKIQTFDVVKDKVREAYVRQRGEEKFAELRDQLASAAYEHPDSLQFAASFNLPIHTSELFIKDKSGKDIAQYKKVRDTAFSNDVLALQNNSDVILVNPETMVVLRVKSHIASALLPLKGIAKQIEEKLKAAEAEERAEKFADDLRAKLQAGADPEKVAASYHFTWNKTGYLGRYSTKVDSAILDLAFRLPYPTSTSKVSLYGVTRLPNGYAIVALQAVKDGTVANKKQNFVFAEQVQNSEGLLEYELYKRSQLSKDNASIKILQQQ
jgi:peptidyl-prolyl cis-trans isomerase D